MICFIVNITKHHVQKSLHVITAMFPIMVGINSCYIFIQQAITVPQLVEGRANYKTVHVLVPQQGNYNLFYQAAYCEDAINFSFQSNLARLLEQKFTFMNLLNFSDFKVGARKHHSDTDRGETKKSPYMLQTHVFDNPSSKTKKGAKRYNKTTEGQHTYGTKQPE